MSQQTSKFWYVPRKELMVPKEDHTYVGSPLKHASSNVDPEIDTSVGDGDGFTVLLKSFYVTQDRDKGDNDILVRSWTRYGSEPHIEVAHFFKENIPAPYFSAGDLLAEHIFSSDRYLGQNRVWIRLQILEVDGKKVDQIATWVEHNLKDTVKTFGAIFPSTLPFIGNISSQALDLFGKLKQLISNKSDVILDQALDFLSIHTGETPLRYGAYIYFQQPVSGEHYRLNQFRVHSDEADPQHQPIPDYVVVEIVPGVVNQFNQDTIELNQSLAMGLLPFDDSQSVEGEKDQRLRYLQTLMKQAQKTSDLKELYQLMKQELSGQLLTEAQRQRYQALTLEHNDYIEIIKEMLD
jgi:hypothetical protein